MSLDKSYNAKNYELKIYRKWEKSGIFRAKIDKKKPPFTIAMPPPNATGTLHLGHATMLAIEDIMIRYKRMSGFSALWLPGTDHASIATQNRVEKDIQKQEGLTRHDLGRTEMLKRIRKFVAESQDTIRNQIRKMGSSCDWSRERYTLDKGLSHAVKTIFVKMYHDGLIYRGNRIVNWCVRCSSTLADDEVVYKEEKTNFYHFRYGPFVIGTVRPETKFLDKIIVVHPKDKRYLKYHHEKFIVPWIEGNVEARVIPDISANPDFGTGAMTITPAHDFTDFDIAGRHKDIEIHPIIDQQGNLTSAAGEFAGMNAKHARAKIVEKLQQKGLIEKIEQNYLHNVSVCYRCSTSIEPLVSKQWFVDVNKPIIKKGRKLISIKQKSIDVVKSGQIKIIPANFNKTYFHWMENLRDWCISRQIWFGHRIPVYYCQTKNCHEIIAQVDKPSGCPKCRRSDFKHDPDTLDTWFSAGLWTFSTLGWPQKTADLKYFHPTSVLETGYDILFFWIARMIILTTYTLGEVPFEKVYLHGLIRDRNGQKMSKSNPETCIDPLDMIEKYGADALRLSMVIGSAPGNDLRLYEEKIAGYRNFINKIWNASRFALLNLKQADFKKTAIDRKKLSLADKWILSRTQKLILEVSNKMENFKFSDAGTQIYDFTWSIYCDWYLEFSKTNKNPAVLLEVLKTILKLLHPFTPYVTEVIWQQLKQNKLLIAESWPKANKKYILLKEEKEIELITKVISGIRSLRQESKIEPHKKIKAVVYAHDHQKTLQTLNQEIKKLANLDQLEILKSGPKLEQSLSSFVSKVEIYLPLSGLLNIQEEKSRLKKELVEKEKFLKSITAKLENPIFMQKAPRQVVEKEQAKRSDVALKIDKIKDQLKALK